MKNYSRQREEIMKILRSTDTHPTAYEVYDMVKVNIPNISLGTVYRNLSMLSKSGKIISIKIGDGMEHFDGNIKPHVHLCCTKCGKIFDTNIENDYILNAAKKEKFHAETTLYLAYGICNACSQMNISD